MSHKALDKTIASFQALTRWHDIEMMKDNDGKLVAMPWGFDPLRRYIAELDNILLTGEIGDIRALQALRKELNITRNEFLKLKGEITE